MHFYPLVPALQLLKYVTHRQKQGVGGRDPETVPLTCSVTLSCDYVAASFLSVKQR